MKRFSDFSRLTWMSLLLCSITTVSLCIAADPGVAQAKASTWTYVPAPREGDSFLNAASCVTDDACFAVGFYSTWHPFIESWNGTSWIVDTTPTLTTNAILNSVSCISASNCVAVGETMTDQADQALLETWNGKVWSLVARPGAGENSTLNGVSCVKSQCIAVGSQLHKKTGTTELVEVRSHGKWSKVNDPVVASPNAVSCVSANECMAVGQGPSAQTWNGTTWSDTSPIAQDYNSTFDDVSCVSSGDCFAVGTYTTKADPNQPGKVYSLVEQWNGEQWSLMSGATVPSLAAISCINADQCAAVGFDDSTATPLIQLWNGTTWSQATAETPPGSEGAFEFSSVSCLASDASCTAVGSYNSARPLVETGSIPT